MSQWKALTPERYSEVLAYIRKRYLPPAAEAPTFAGAAPAEKKRPGLPGLSGMLRRKSKARFENAPAPSAPCPAEKQSTAFREEVCSENAAVQGLESALRERLAHADETFSQALSRILREKDLTEPEVYNRVFMDRKLFSKIRNAEDYQPSKRTALLLAIGLGLNLDETRDFIGKAGFALTRSSRADIIVEYFLLHRIYDVQEIDETLYAFGEPTLNK